MCESQCADDEPAVRVPCCQVCGGELSDDEQVSSIQVVRVSPNYSRRVMVPKCTDCWFAEREAFPSCIATSCAEGVAR